MIDMFTNYQNLSDYYIPNNLNKHLKSPQSYTKLCSNINTKPYELYNAKGELEGYYWYQGKKIVLDFSIDGEIMIDANDLILTGPGEEPSVRTEGRIGTKAYNISDLKSWTCVAYSVNSYIWELDSSFKYPDSGEKSVYINAAEYLKDKTLTFNIYNFRMECIYSISIAGSSNIRIDIDDELSNKLVKGIYYCSLDVSGKEIHETIFSYDDCKLLVK